MPEAKFKDRNFKDLNREDLNEYVTRGQEKVQTFLTEAKEPTAARLAELAEKLRPRVETLPFAAKLSSLPSAETLVDKPFHIVQKLLDANRRWSGRYFAAGTMDTEQADKD